MFNDSPPGALERDTKVDSFPAPPARSSLAVALLVAM